MELGRRPEIDLQIEVAPTAGEVLVELAAAGLAGWIVNVWGVGYKLRHVPRAELA